jgi:Ribbon-helix-helix protein, copG family
VRTTITIDDHLLAEVKERAAKTGRTASEIIEDAVRSSFLRERHYEQERWTLELPTFNSGGYQPGVDLDNNAALLDLMEGIE